MKKTHIIKNTYSTIKDTNAHNIKSTKTYNIKKTKTPNIKTINIKKKHLP
jgi:hypothetical protein